MQYGFRFLSVDLHKTFDYKRFDVPQLLVRLCFLYAFVFRSSVLKPDLDLCVAEVQQLRKLRPARTEERLWYDDQRRICLRDMRARLKIRYNIVDMAKLSITQILVVRVELQVVMTDYVEPHEQMHFVWITLQWNNPLPLPPSLSLTPYFALKASRIRRSRCDLR